MNPPAFPAKPSADPAVDPPVKAEATAEVCTRCHREISRLETPRIWEGQVVCSQCRIALSSPHTVPEEKLTPLQHATRDAARLDQLAATGPASGISINAGEELLFVICLILAVFSLLGGWFGLGSRTSRFQDDNAYGAAANALDMMLAVFFSCAVPLLLLILAVLVRINAHLRTLARRR